MKLGIAIALILTGCGASTAENATTASTYEAQQLACIDAAKTRAQADECRCKVMLSYGRSCPIVADAGLLEGGVK